jgi:hypothetical protein
MKAGPSTAIYPMACSLSLHGDRVSQIERASFTALSTSRGRAGELPVELQHDVSAGVGILRSYLAVLACVQMRHQKNL